MKILLLLFLLSVLTLAKAQVRPVTLCSSGSNGVVTEGGYFDFVSSAPDGFRTSIHTFSYIPQDSATYNSQFFFKQGSSVGFEAVRWPWILHYTETVGNTASQARTYEPIPLVIGEQPVGYLLVADLVHDILEFRNRNSLTDGILTVVPGLFVVNPPLFDPISLHNPPTDSLRVCFTYTLDQFGGLARTAGGFRLKGYNGAEFLLPSAPEGVYALISHRALAVSGRMCSARSGESCMCEAGVTLADGHRFVIEAQGSEGRPALDVHLPTGDRERLILDETLTNTVHALPLEFADGEDSDAVGVRSQLFVRAFSNNEEALQDPAIANYFGLGDLDHLDLDVAHITARVLLTTWAFEVTLVAVEENGEASIELLTHGRVFSSGSDLDVTTLAASPASGILGKTFAIPHIQHSLEAFELEHDSVLATAFAGSLFQH